MTHMWLMSHRGKTSTNDFISTPCIYVNTYRTFQLWVMAAYLFLIADLFGKLGIYYVYTTLTQKCNAIAQAKKKQKRADICSKYLFFPLHFSQHTVHFERVLITTKITKTASITQSYTHMNVQKQRCVIIYLLKLKAEEISCFLRFDSKWLQHAV